SHGVGETRRVSRRGYRPLPRSRGIEGRGTKSRNGNEEERETMSGKAWDKGILLATGLAVIGVSVLFSMRALGFVEHFGMTEATPKNDLPETAEHRAVIAKSYVEKTQ